MTQAANLGALGTNAGTTGILASTGGGTGTTAGVTGFKNRIINGAMVIDQRNAGASVTPTNGQYTLDRWYFSVSQASKLTSQQNADSVTPPVGFINYLGVTSSSAYSVLTGDYFGFRQSIEGLNVADLGWGTANAKTVTLSFWVRSSLTGSFGGSLFNSSANRSYPFSYTISTANTWEQKSITIAGDTTGTWLTTNGNGIQVYFSLGAGSTYSGTANAWTGGTWASQPTGSTSVVGTNGATFYITGCQLEVGSTATSFDYRPYGTELALCQRYLPWFNTGNGGGGTQAYNSTKTIVLFPFKVSTRVPATGVVTSGTFRQLNSSGGGITITSIVFNGSDVTQASIETTVASGLTGGDSTLFYSASSSEFVYFTGCEL